MKKFQKAWITMLTVILMMSAISPALAASETKQAGKSAESLKKVNLADSNATASTRSLFVYLQSIRGNHTLFGHQHATDEALSAKTGTGPASDDKSAVGDYPAMFGWDTLSLEGLEKPGSTSNTSVQNRDNLVKSMRQAYEIGGVLTLSSHMPNFVTGKDFYDTSGNVVSHILPGGDKHAEYNAFLDKIADFAHHLKDSKGNNIPIIFRPFHEQNGGWFWWGAPYATKEQYIEIYRYTVEYLRDIKGVHNFLYAFSPGSPFNNLETTYLKTYPGDDYVDILGFDTYYDGSNQGWFDTVVDDAKLLSKLADVKGKVAAFTEFGYSGVKPTGTADKNFYTKLIHAMQSDPDASRLAYMLTWANFNYDSIFVPYRNSSEYGDHELLPDFVNYYKDPYTYFSRDLKNVYTHKATTTKEEPFMHIVSPTGQETIRTNTTTIRARVLNEKVSKVVYSIGNSSAEYPMSLAQNGYYQAEWRPSPELNGKGTELTVKTYGKNKAVLKQTITVYVGIPEITLKTMSFDKGIDEVSNNGTWPTTMESQFSYAKLGDEGKLRIDVKNMVGTDSWQELKIGLPKITAGDLKNVNRVSFDAWIPMSAGSKNPDASLHGAAELPPSSTKFETKAPFKLKDLNTVTVNGTVYGKYTASIDLNDEKLRQAANGLSIALIGSGLDYTGPVYVDNIRLINAYTGESTDPYLVDNYEGYKGSDDLLRAAYSPNGDANTISLAADHKAAGDYGLKLDYTLAGQAYTGVTLNLGSRDWSSRNKLKFWLEPDGKNKKLVIQVKANDVSFEYYPSLADTTPRWVEIPFEDFVVASWDSNNAGKKLDAVNAAKIQAFSVYVNAPAGESYTKDNPFKSTIYVDGIEAISSK
ncbi:Mannan endo-1,4-beta-mannosidase precursor [compost metagenome]